MFCRWCGKRIAISGKSCPHCGREQPPLESGNLFWDLCEDKSAVPAATAPAPAAAAAQNSAAPAKAPQPPAPAKAPQPPTPAKAPQPPAPADSSKGKKRAVWPAVAGVCIGVAVLCAAGAAFMAVQAKRDRDTLAALRQQLTALQQTLAEQQQALAETEMAAGDSAVPPDTAPEAPAPTPGPTDAPAADDAGDEGELLTSGDLTAERIESEDGTVLYQAAGALADREDARFTWQVSRDAGGTWQTVAEDTDTYQTPAGETGCLYRVICSTAQTVPVELSEGGSSEYFAMEGSSEETGVYIYSVAETLQTSADCSYVWQKLDEYGNWADYSNLPQCPVNAGEAGAYRLLVTKTSRYAATCTPDTGDGAPALDEEIG